MVSSHSTLNCREEISVKLLLTSKSMLIISPQVAPAGATAVTVSVGLGATVSVRSSGIATQGAAGASGVRVMVIVPVKLSGGV
ncbi:MAG: hypothetical protein EPGJADBJ_05289 [Saprospiraceae bacterium]|nr:hypothetical protein [Saprospiraceae bacterium]